MTTLPATWLLDAQLSRDGKWALFTDKVQSRSAIQMVRIDGQYLQTLYCAKSGESVKSLLFAGSGSTQLSPDQKHLVFATGPDFGAPTLYLLTMSNGKLDTLFKPTSPTQFGYLSRTWMTNSLIYLTGMLPNSDAPAMNLYLLDINNGVNQSVSMFKQVIDTTNIPCWDFDSSYDATQLFFNQCEQKGGSLGSGRIDQLPPMGGAPRLIINSQQLAITHIRTFEYGRASKLLFSVYNSGMGINFDHRKDGLWLINIDGTGLQRLTTSSNVVFNQFSQYPWSNVSRDGHYFAVTPVSSLPGESIFYGTFNGTGTTLAKIASRGAGIDEVQLVGWTAA